MTTISVPLPADLEKELNNLVKTGYGSNKADVVRRAIKRASEEEVIQTILKAQQEVGLKGDLKELAKKFR